MSQPKIQHITTQDGSSSLYQPALDEHYHSIHGAYTESMHVFIRMGLEPLLAQQKEHIRVMEVGFGTGLNAWLTALHSLDHHFMFHYVGLELQPLEQDLISSLNYTHQHPHPQAKPLWEAIHGAPWNEPHTITPHFTLEKQEFDWTRHWPTGTFDLIYYDAFAPNKQPEMWTPELLEKCYALLNPGGVWVTYTSKGDVRRGLIGAGFTVEKVPGPPGKREMLRAIKT